MTVLDTLPCSLPSGALPTDLSAESLGEEFAAKLSALLSTPDSSVLAKDAVWRDLFAVTGSIRTFYGAETCLARWTEHMGKAAAGAFQYQPGSGRVVSAGPASSWLQCSYTFHADAKPKRDCEAIVSLAYDEGRGSWVIWVIRTVLGQLSDHPNVDRLEATANGTGKSSAAAQRDGVQFDCVVIGGGQAGLSVGGRLAALGVSYIVLEKNKGVGDNWRNRYRSTKRELTPLPPLCTRSESFQLSLTPSSAYQPRVMCESRPSFPLDAERRRH
jgi:hypothetical protein